MTVHSFMYPCLPSQALRLFPCLPSQALRCTSSSPRLSKPSSQVPSPLGPYRVGAQSHVFPRLQTLFFPWSRRVRSSTSLSPSPDAVLFLEQSGSIFYVCPLSPCPFPPSFPSVQVQASFAFRRLLLPEDAEGPRRVSPHIYGFSVPPELVVLLLCLLLLCCKRGVDMW